MLSEFLTEPVFAKGLSVSSNICYKASSPNYCLCVCAKLILPLVWPVCVGKPRDYSRLFRFVIASHTQWFLYPEHVYKCCWWFTSVNAFCSQSYLNTFAFNNTVYTDLWDHFQQVGTLKNLNDVTWQCVSVYVFKLLLHFFIVVRQLKTHKVYIFLIPSKTSWTTGLFRWASQWLLLTPGQEVSARNTSCWIQTL